MFRRGGLKSPSGSGGGPWSAGPSSSSMGGTDGSLLPDLEDLLLAERGQARAQADEDEATESL